MARRTCSSRPESRLETGVDGSIDDTISAPYPLWLQRLSAASRSRDAYAGDVSSCTAARNPNADEWNVKKRPPSRGSHRLMVASPASTHARVAAPSFNFRGLRFRTASGARAGTAGAGGTTGGSPVHSSCASTTSARSPSGSVVASPSPRSRLTDAISVSAAMASTHHGPGERRRASPPLLNTCHNLITRLPAGMRRHGRGRRLYCARAWRSACRILSGSHRAL